MGASDAQLWPNKVEISLSTKHLKCVSQRRLRFYGGQTYKHTNQPSHRDWTSRAMEIRESQVVTLPITSGAGCLGQKCVVEKPCEAGATVDSVPQYDYNIVM